MEYINQTEKIFKYLELNLDFKEKYFLLTLKRKFNNDLNLFGCFIKDYLIIKNKGIVSKDEEIYNDFVLFFEENSKLYSKRTLLDDIDIYALHYLTIVFEECNYEPLLSAISTINSCFMLDAYPYLMVLIARYFNLEISENEFNFKLQNLVDLVINKMEEPFDCENLYNLLSLEDNINLDDSSERLVG